MTDDLEIWKASEIHPQAIPPNKAGKDQYEPAMLTTFDLSTQLQPQKIYSFYETKLTKSKIIPTNVYFSQQQKKTTSLNICICPLNTLYSLLKSMQHISVLSVTQQQCAGLFNGMLSKHTGPALKTSLVYRAATDPELKQMVESCVVFYSPLIIARGGRAITIST